MFMVIDGSAIVSTHYFGTLPQSLKNYALKDSERTDLFYQIKHSKKGYFTNAVESSLQFILNLIDSNKNLDKMLICFDRSRNTFRKELYPEYKANRKEKDEPLKEQMKTFEELLNYVGIKTLSSSTYEADDLAGSVITKFKGTEPIYFLTKDHDWFQLLDDEDQVKGLLIENTVEAANSARMKYGHLDENNICTSGPIVLSDKLYAVDSKVCEEMEGVISSLIPDKKGMSGDKSDNIPGIKGVGDSSSIPLLNRYGSLEGIFAEINIPFRDKDTLKALWKTDFSIGPKKFDKIAEAEKDALLSKELATIKTDCDIPVDASDYTIHLDNNKLQKILNYYELKIA